MFEPCPDLSNPSERFQTDSELLKNSVEQWRTDVPPAVDRYGHCSAIGAESRFFVIWWLAAQFEAQSSRRRGETRLHGR